MELRLPYPAEEARDDESSWTGSLRSRGSESLESLLASIAQKLHGEAVDLATSQWPALNASQHDVEDELGPDDSCSNISRALEQDLSSELPDLTDVSIVTLPISSSASLDQSSAAAVAPAQNVIDKPAHQGRPALETLRRLLRQAIDAQSPYQRAVLMLACLLSLARPSNIDTELAPPSYPVDFVELVSTRNESALPLPSSRQEVEAVQSASSSVALLLAGLACALMLGILARRGRSRPAPSPRKKRTATPAPASMTPKRKQKPAVTSKKAAAPVQLAKTQLDEDQLCYNVCLMGSEKVGLTSLLARQLFGDKADLRCEELDKPSHDAYEQAYRKRGAPTITLALRDWHDAGTRREVGQRGLHVAVVVCAIDDQASLVQAQNTIKQVKAAGKQTGQLKAVYLVANKSDLRDIAGPATTVRLAATLKRAEAFAAQEGITLFETSAKTGEGVMDLFRTIARNLRA